MLIKLQAKRWADEVFYHWWTVCICFDNEALGYLERMLQATGVETRVIREDVKCPS